VVYDTYEVQDIKSQLLVNWINAEDIQDREELVPRYTIQKKKKCVVYKALISGCLLKRVNIILILFKDLSKKIRNHLFSRREVY